VALERQPTPLPDDEPQAATPDGSAGAAPGTRPASVKH